MYAGQHWPETESPTMPVDIRQSVPVAGSIPHSRKLAFLFGVLATSLALLLVHNLGVLP